MNQSLRKKVLLSILEMRGFNRLSSEALVGASMKGAKNLKHVIIKATRALVDKERNYFKQNIQIERIRGETIVRVRGRNGKFRDDLTIGRNYVEFH